VLLQWTRCLTAQALGPKPAAAWAWRLRWWRAAAAGTVQPQCQTLEHLFIPVVSGFWQGRAPVIGERLGKIWVAVLVQDRRQSG